MNRIAQKPAGKLLNIPYLRSQPGLLPCQPYLHILQRLQRSDSSGNPIPDYRSEGLKRGNAIMMMHHLNIRV
jgi:hypothetical protein